MKTAETLKKAISSALTSLSLPETTISLEHPQDDSFGDYSTNVAMVLYPQVKDAYSSPRQLAESITGKITGLKASIAGPGFINFTLSNDHLLGELKSILDNKDSYGSNQSLSQEKIVVEYTDPNPFKEFHIGHLYSNAVGESIARLLEFSGAKVWRADYYGDVGIHVAKSVYGMNEALKDQELTLEEIATWDVNKRQQFMGQAYAFGSKMYDSNETIHQEIESLNIHLYCMAQLVNEEHDGFLSQVPYTNFIKHESPIGFHPLKDLYYLGRLWSLAYFETLYTRLGTKFNGYYPESKVGESGYQIVQKHLGSIFEESQGAIVYKGEKVGLHTRVFINKHGLPTYEAKELGLPEAKYHDFPYTQSIIVTAAEINEYFKVLLAALNEVSPKLGSVTTHIGHGLVKLPEGKMSSRTGTIISGDSLMNQTSAKALEIIQNLNPDLPQPSVVADQIGIGAIKYAFLKNGIGSDIIFKLDDALSFNGNSGPYLQYTRARCQSVLEKSKIKLTDPRSQILDPKSYNPDEMAILRWLYRFPEVVSQAATSYSPHCICTYLYELAGRYNAFYNKHSILGSVSQPVNQETSQLRLTLTAATGQVIKNGLSLLGIQSPDRM